MLNELTGDLLVHISYYLHPKDFYAVFVLSKDWSGRAASLVSLRWPGCGSRRQLNQLYNMVQKECLRFKTARDLRIQFPLYNNRRRLRREETPILMF
jgi:hypothetical protein